MASQNASVQISQIFTSRKIVLDLMDKQGYNINDYANFSINEVNSMKQNNQLDMLLETRDDKVTTENPKKKIYIRYYLGVRPAPKNLQEMIDDLFVLTETLKKTDTLFIIIKDDPNETLINVEKMLPALDKAIVGPAADYRTAMLRIGQQLGVAGADANEQLANTRIVVQGLAQQELDAAAQMRGQGSLTEGERGILRRAAAGDQTLSAAEIRQALASAQKTARYRLATQEDYLKRAMKIPGFEQFAPMYQVTPYGGGGGGGGGDPLLNAIDRQLQLRSGGGPR